jgi:hypothetical protein
VALLEKRIDHELAAIAASACDEHAHASQRRSNHSSGGERASGLHIGLALGGEEGGR